MNVDSKLGILAVYILNLTQDIPIRQCDIVYKGLLADDSIATKILQAHTIKSIDWHLCGSIIIDQTHYSLFLYKDKDRAWFIKS